VSQGPVWTLARPCRRVVRRNRFTIGAARAQKEAHFNRLKELIAKFRTSICFISSQFPKFVPLSAIREAFVVVAIPAALMEETTATPEEEEKEEEKMKTRQRYFSRSMTIEYDLNFPTLMRL